MVQLLHGDCLALLPQLADGSVDMVFADLPYGVTANKWDVVIPFAPLWRELLRVGKRNCAFVFTATQPFATALINSQPKLFRYDIVWRKHLPVGYLNAKRAPLRAHESVLIFASRQTVYNPQMTAGGRPYKHNYRTARQGSNYGTRPVYIKRSDNDGARYPVSVISPDGSRIAQRVHPTQKPVALLEWLVNTYSNPGDTVLDPTMGSGTTGVACVNTGRGFVGIESDPTYYATAQQRVCAPA